MGLSVCQGSRKPVLLPLSIKIGDRSILNYFRILLLGKLAHSLFPVTHSLPKVAHAGDFFYVVGFLVSLILWGFSVVWFIVAVVMIATSGGFPFNMGRWGFIFPVGQC